MKIKYMGKDYELSTKEKYSASTMKVIDFMAAELSEQYGFSEKDADMNAKYAYELYAAGDGYTECDCIMAIAEYYGC